MAAERPPGAICAKPIQPRNPHPDFKSVEASRPPWDSSHKLEFVQTADPSWQFGAGPNPTADRKLLSQSHIPIDPYAPDRPINFNYKLLISAIVPRPIALLSTRSPDGTTTNLAPFSYFGLIGHEPPLFAIGFVGGLPTTEVATMTRDSLRNLHESGECVINLVSEDFTEATNSTSIHAPYGVSEWDVSGLTPVYDCETVACARVKEAVFSIEGKVESVREFKSRADPGKVTSTMAVIEGTRFWAREDSINEDRNLLDPKVLRPVSRLGGITYGRTLETFELLRPDFEKDLGGVEGAKKLEPKHVPN